MKTTLTFAALLVPLAVWAAPAEKTVSVRESISVSPSDRHGTRSTDGRDREPPAASREDRHDYYRHDHRSAPRHDDRKDNRDERNGDRWDDHRHPAPAPVARFDYDRAIRNAYRAVLEREPDDAGLRNYRERMKKEGWSEDRLRAALRDSAEFRGTVVNTIIARAYREILGRAPDAAGLENYRHKIVARGLSEEGLRRTLLDSAEYRDRLVTIAANDTRNTHANRDAGRDLGRTRGGPGHDGRVLR